MACTFLPGGVIVCTRGARRAEPCQEPGCTESSVALCDWPLTGERSGSTCDRRMCARHRTPVGKNRDYCGAHARAAKEPAPMSTADRRIPVDGAKKLAAAVVAALAPACERIEVAGSIRRERSSIGDVEIVAVPRMVEGPRVDMFAPPPLVSALDQVLGELAAAGKITQHPVRPANGERYKRLWLARTGVQLDLFLVLPPAEWVPIFAIRTGPADYSRAAVTALRERGLRCEDGRILRGNEVVPCPDEETFFALAGMPMLAPAARGA